ncbi:MAG: hypothetical protein HQL67_10890 [Magnetococcales bacterium]|nr:hypothetical protein [Magnetococcales bacterium]
MSFEEALADSLEDILDEFGVPVIYTPKGGEAVNLTALFEKEWVDKNIGGEGYGAPMVNAPQPVLTVRLSDLQSPSQAGDLVTVNSKVYKVRFVTDHTTQSALLKLKTA